MIKKTQKFFRRFSRSIANNPILALMVLTTILLAIQLVSLSRDYQTPIFEINFRSFISAVIAGIVASLFTAVLISILKVRENTHELRKWLSFGNADVTITPTYLTIENPRYSGMPYKVVPPHDAKAAGIIDHLARKAGYYLPRRKLLGSYNFQPYLLEDNIVTFCIPEINKYSLFYLALLHEKYSLRPSVANQPEEERISALRRDLSNSLSTKSPINPELILKTQYFGLVPIPYYNKKTKESINVWFMHNPDTQPPNHLITSDFYYEFIESHKLEPDHAKLKKAGQTLQNIPGLKSISDKEETFVDFCLIIRAPNPCQPRSSILIICGIHGAGTVFGANYLYYNLKQIYKEYGNKPQSLLLEIRTPKTKQIIDYIDTPYSDDRVTIIYQRSLT